jgi:hypothetical protein
VIWGRSHLRLLPVKEPPHNLSGVAFTRIELDIEIATLTITWLAFEGVYNGILWPEILQLALP